MVTAVDIPFRVQVVVSPKSARLDNPAVAGHGEEPEKNNVKFVHQLQLGMMSIGMRIWT